MGMSSYKDRRNGLVPGWSTVLPRRAEAGVCRIPDAVVQDEVFATVEVHNALGSRTRISYNSGPTHVAVAEWLLGPYTKVAARL